MGRFKLDTYWYVFALASAVLIAIGLYQLATAQELEMGDPGWFEHSDDKWDAGFVIFGGVLAGIMAAQLWAKQVSRIKVPKEVRKPKKN